MHFHLNYSWKLKYNTGKSYIAPIKNQLNMAFPLTYYLSPIGQVCLHLLWARLYTTFIQVQLSTVPPFFFSQGLAM